MILKIKITHNPSCTRLASLENKYNVIDISGLNGNDRPYDRWVTGTGHFININSLRSMSRK